MALAQVPMMAEFDERDDVLELSIVMPCLNEARTVGTCIEKAQRSLVELGIRGEVVVADNGSTDGSQAIAESLGARVVDVTEKGYGAALRGGIAAARGRYVIMGDADDSYDFSALDGFVDQLREGHQLVMGNRFLGGIKPGAMPFLHRYLGNPGLSFVGRLFFKSRCGDFQCGLRGFDRQAILDLNLHASSMVFSSEMVVQAALRGLDVVEIPTTLSPDGRDRAPHLRTWSDGWRYLRFLLLYCPRWLFFVPGAAMMLMGLAVSAWLLPGARAIGGVYFDYHTLLFAAMSVIVGMQAVMFALFTKTYAISEGLLPPDPKFARWSKVLRLETGLVVGALVFLIGLVMAVMAVLSWRSHHFGELVSTHELRISIVAVTALVAGSEIVLASFFMSVLRLARR